MSQSLSTQCCIAGGGPAGMMLGFLLAREGIDVLVLEKHIDFLRDFRGDTIHPSTLTVMDDLGLLEEFLALPHQRVSRLSANVYGEVVTIADFTHLGTVCPYLVMMPQWDFLDFLARNGQAHSTFRLRMGTRATGLIERDGAIVGVRAECDGEPVEIACSLAVAADGRHTTLRESAGLPLEDAGAPIDVLWFRLTRDPSKEDAQTGGYIRPGLFLVAINRDAYWQCAYVIPKGSLQNLRAAGLDALKANVRQCAPFLGAALDELRDWDDLKLLTVQVNRLLRWHRDGLLCIGDAAHAMSPVGGVGINLAIQDAVAAANLLAAPLREGRLRTEDLAAVQRRRDWPTRVTQRMQIAVQNEVLAPVLAAQREPVATAPQSLPLALQLMRRLPMLSRIPARMVGVGVRPERVRNRARR
jgi:2-polyprenyl-6-methoxyphenol hydroxylase-like FAD-dependent oxidoreductase